MTYNDFIMESAMVETTNSTTVSDIEIEQFYAEYNVGCAAYNAFEKYSVITEYAQCGIEEFIQESLDDKIDKVDEWKNSGGKMKKIAGTVASAALKAIRAIKNFFINLFSKENNPFAKLSRKIKALKERNAKASTDAEVDAIIDEVNKNEKQIKKSKKFGLFVKKAKVPFEQWTKIIKEAANDKIELDSVRRENAQLKAKVDKLQYEVVELEKDKAGAENNIKLLKKEGLTLNEKKKAAQHRLEEQEKEAQQNAIDEAEGKRLVECMQATELLIHKLETDEGAKMDDSRKKEIFETFITSSDSPTKAFNSIYKAFQTVMPSL